MRFLEVKNVSKRYGGSAYALKGVQFSADKGKLLAVCGENGAGKSTLMKILAGVIQPNSGDIYINGEKVEIKTPQHAFNLGIRTVYQELSLDPNLSVTENMLMGRMPTKKLSWWVDWATAHEQAQAIIDELGFKGIDVKATTSRLSVSFQQMVEIAKAVVVKPQILILDEPSAVLSQNELAYLFRLIDRLKEAGTTILYISHRLDEVFNISDEITILKDGETVDNVRTVDVTPNDLIRKMVGRPLETIFPEVKHSKGEVSLELSNYSKSNVFQDFNLSLHRGEIVGLFGLVGSGRSEVMRCVFGADTRDSGEMWMDGEPIDISSPRDAVKRRMAFVTEERKNDGLSLTGSILDNAGLATMDQVSKNTVIDIEKQKSSVRQKADEMSIKRQSIFQAVGELSGGNQQKVVLEKWLLLSNLKVLILDEPTRGVDIGTKVEIYHLIEDLASSGVAVVLISSEMPEILGMSDRIIVMREGLIVGEFPKKECTEERLLACASGITENEPLEA